MQSPRHSAFWRTMIYLVFGVVWILYSDRFLETIVDDVQTLTQLQTYKGWIYVVITAGLLYVLLYHGLKKERTLSSRDELTQLLNQHMFRRELESELAFASENQQKVALITFNIDDFRRINHVCSHSVGDELLADFANLLHDFFAEHPNLMARIGADEFAVALLNIKNAENAVLLIRELQESFKRIPVEGYQTELTIGAGLAMFPSDADNLKDLLACTNLAQEEAKNLGPGQLRLYDHFFGESIHSRLQLTADLRHAIENKGLTVAYQPLFATHSMQLTGVEALLRWNHPHLGPIRPDTFITLAEQQGLISRITDYVFEHAITELTASGLLGGQIPQLSINVSAIDFAETKSVERFYQRLNHLNDWSLLKLELTETAVINNFEETLKALTELGQAKIHLSIDDFGTGYSSLNILRRLPIHEVKIDRSFIRDIEHDDDDRTIVRTILAMAHSLDLKVVGEGVENTEQLKFLHKHGCHEVQGFLMAKPMNVNELSAFLDDLPAATDTLKQFIRSQSQTAIAREL